MDKLIKSEALNAPPATAPIESQNMAEFTSLQQLRVHLGTS